MTVDNTCWIDGRPVALADDRNLLELIRRAGIDLPTFCYHSDLSVYGACRLCIVEVEGRGVQAACSTAPEPGMRVQTNTATLRAARKLTIELQLANHDRECPTCVRSHDCSLQSLARRLGVEEVRFATTAPEAMHAVDRSSPSLVRDPNKCVLCGDCVRMCSEVQGVGALDFIKRGSEARVAPAFDQGLGMSECVGCGQCAAVCPTGALVPQDQRGAVWDLLHDPEVVVVAQLAPAVRVALGEYFGFEPGSVVTGRIVAALRMIGFDRVYDTAFTADMTVLEESQELLGRIQSGEQLPQFTSCCPAWVRWAEQYAPDLLGQLSSCKSPQQMFGALARQVLGEDPELAGKRLAVISIMPCTAKKAEAALPQHRGDTGPDVDHVLTTQELGRMLMAAGVRFADLEDEAFDLPLGFASGAGVIFGASGGVAEAALRYLGEQVDGRSRQARLDWKQVRGNAGRREARVTLGDTQVGVAVVHGLQEARSLVEEVRAGRSDLQFIEVMACPGGCIAGAGQPISKDENIRARRAQGLYRADSGMPLQTAQDNHLLERCYEEHLGAVGGHAAHELLHTDYQDRSAVFHQPQRVREGSGGLRVHIDGGCDHAGAHGLVDELDAHCEGHPSGDAVSIDCSVRPGGCATCGTVIKVGRNICADANQARAAIDRALAAD